jgi:hypothetical protein
MSRWNAKLIRANIALYIGDYTEARRWLADYQTEGIAAEHASQVMWLDAHTQPEPAERLGRLGAMVAQLAPSDPYADLARAALEAERAAEPPAPKTSRWPRIGIWVGLVLIGSMAAFALNGGNPPPTSRPTVTPTVMPTATLPPDRSTPLTGEGYTVRYSDGLLSAVGIEDSSVRVVRLNSDDFVTPLDGARFYALEVAFECRSSICNNPPQGQLKLRLADGSHIEPRRELGLFGQDILTPIALGRITRGWVIFEIPVISPAAALEITYRDSATNLDSTVEINLGGVTP